MIKSMTGFGRYEALTDERRLLVEIRSVNHRYLDMTIKMPRYFNSMEAKMRELVKRYLNRGKVDIFVTYDDYQLSDVDVKYNKALARGYYDKLWQMHEDLNIDFDIRTSTLSRYPDVIQLVNIVIDEDGIWEVLEEALSGALRELVMARTAEGLAIGEDILIKLDSLKYNVQYIDDRTPIIIGEYRDKLSMKVREMLDNIAIDEARLLTEVAILADKTSVDEEIVRLNAHIDAMRDAIVSDADIGRKLDFITQEMNREANTILSKSGDLIMSEVAIEIKTLIEKVREQIQNIE